MPADKQDEWLHQMNEPLPSQVGSGKPKPTQAQLEQEGSDFLNFMTQHTKNVGGG